MSTEFFPSGIISGLSVIVVAVGFATVFMTIGVVQDAAQRVRSTVK